MRIRVIPFVVAVILIGTAVFFLTMTGPVRRSLDAPVVYALIDVAGIETDLAIAPDGVRYAVISSGNLWFVNHADGTRGTLDRHTALGRGPSGRPSPRLLW